MRWETVAVRESSACQVQRAGTGSAGRPGGLPERRAGSKAVSTAVASAAMAAERAAEAATAVLLPTAPPGEQTPPPTRYHDVRPLWRTELLRA